MIGWLATFFFIITIHTDTVIVVLICLFLMISDAEHYCVHCYPFCAFFGKESFRSFAHLFIKLYFLLLSFMGSLCILDIKQKFFFLSKKFIWLMILVVGRSKHHGTGILVRPTHPGLWHNVAEKQKWPFAEGGVALLYNNSLLQEQIQW